MSLDAEDKERDRRVHDRLLSQPWFALGMIVLVAIGIFLVSREESLRSGASKVGTVFGFVLWNWLATWIAWRTSGRSTLVGAAMMVSLGALLVAGHVHRHDAATLKSTWMVLTGAGLAGLGFTACAWVGTLILRRRRRQRQASEAPGAWSSRAAVPLGHEDIEREG